MRILSFKPGHDGHIAYLADGALVFSHEAEKDSGYRYAPVDISMMLDAAKQLKAMPDVIALSGWTTSMSPDGRPIGAGYWGLDFAVQDEEMFGKKVKIFTSSHEKSHIFCSYALSPFPQGQPCYALILEGNIGTFYSVEEDLSIHRLTDVMVAPGIRYAFAYGLADPTFKLGPGKIRLSDAGKLMALAAFDEGPAEPSTEEVTLLDKIFSEPLEIPHFHKNEFISFLVYDSGVESLASKRLARLVSDYVLNYFKKAIQPFILEKRPLLIGGGCGLNCDWNRAWLDSQMFSDVFVPPCTNDTGSAIGTAADAQFVLTGNAKLQWNVYSGQSFFDDLGIETNSSIGDFKQVPSDIGKIASLLLKGAILGWITGNAEIGPRALGNRSLLAAPFTKETLKRLNTIKRREPYRPIAPVCLAEDASLHFDINCPSPHMLYFCRVRTDKLKAITHVDGSARVQTVTEKDNPKLYELLSAFKRISGFGVLCNTSLNFNGAGFINRTSDLAKYAAEVGLDGFVVASRLFLHKEKLSYDSHF